MRTVTVLSGFQRDKDGNEVKDKDGKPVASKRQELVPLRLQMRYMQYNPGEVAGFRYDDAVKMVQRGIAVHIDEPEAKEPPPARELGNRKIAGATRSRKKK